MQIKVVKGALRRKGIMGPRRVGARRRPQECKVRLINIYNIERNGGSNENNTYLQEHKNQQNHI